MDIFDNNGTLAATNMTTNGIVQGVGTFQGPLQQTPENSYSISGEILQIPISSRRAGELTVTDTATLGGFQPTLGHSYTILNAGNVIGQLQTLATNNEDLMLARHAYALHR